MTHPLIAHLLYGDLEAMPLSVLGDAGPLPFERWLELNEEEEGIRIAELGIDFNHEDYLEERYQDYLVRYGLRHPMAAAVQAWLERRLHVSGHLWDRSKHLPSERVTGLARLQAPEQLAPAPSHDVSGIRLNLGSGSHPIPGFVNLDKDSGWLFEDGLPYPDASVDAITISHALVCIPATTVVAVLHDCHRVLRVGGILRITEDHGDLWKWGGAQSSWTPSTLAHELHQAGFEVEHCGSDRTGFRDCSLMQDWHPDAPSFWIEGTRSDHALVAAELPAAELLEALLEGLDTLSLVAELTPVAGSKEALQEAFDVARAAVTKAKGILELAPV